MSVYTDLAGLRAKRQQRSRRRRLLTTLVVLLVAILVGAGLWLVMTPTVFAVRHVEVSGTTVIKPDVILEAAAVPHDGPLLVVDRAGIADRVDNVAGVGEVKVGVRLPDTVTVTITELPVIFVTGTDGAYVWHDNQGRAFHTTAQRPKDAIAAQLDSKDTALAKDVATVIVALTPQLRSKVTQITARSRESIQLTLNTGATVVWGSADDSAKKVDVIETMLKIKARVYDVSSPSHPTTRS